MHLVPVIVAFLVVFGHFYNTNPLDFIKVGGSNSTTSFFPWPLDSSMLKNFQSKCLKVFKTAYLKILRFYKLTKSILACVQKSKTLSVIPFWKAILMYNKVVTSSGHFSDHFKWHLWWSGSIYKKWSHLEDIEARALKFCMWPCMTNTHARKKCRLNPRTKIYFDTPY